MTERVMKLPAVLQIQPLAKAPNCAITVPGSKSITNRALILAALSEAKCTLRGALWADDTQVMVESLQRLGFAVEVSPDPNEECNRTIVVEGRGGEIPAKKAELFVGNAGTAARFLTALVCLGHGEYTIRGDARMHERPMKDLFALLREWDAVIESPNNRLPATVRARGLQPKPIVVATDRSSQFASALLLIARAAGANDAVAVKDAADDENGYVAMTRAMVDQFTADYVVEPDLSSASYFKAAEFICGGFVGVMGWPTPSLQVDGKFLKYLPPPHVISRLFHLGDTVLTLAICALFGKEPLRVTDAARLREQECDRIAAMVTELRRVGARAEEHEDGFTVWPAQAGQLHEAEVETYHDHRTAMCFAVLGLKIGGLRIKNPACVSKTFPNFFEKLEELRR